MSAIVAPARALRRPRRLDLRAVFGLFLLLLATGGSVAVWSSTTATRAVLVATRDLPAGAAIAAGDLAVAQVQVDDRIYQAAVPAAEQAALIGRQLAEPVYAQQLLSRAQLTTRAPLAPDEVLVTVPASAASAAGGRVRPGDTVRVLLTTNSGGPTARTSVVLARAVVYEVGSEGGDTIVTTGSMDGRARDQRPVSWLTLRVTEEAALQLVQAKWAGELDIALLPLQ